MSNINLKIIEQLLNKLSLNNDIVNIEFDIMGKYIIKVAKKPDLENIIDLICK